MTAATTELGNVLGGSTRSARSQRLWRRRLMRRLFVADFPINDWIALGLLLWMLAMLGWSVELAAWGELPSIVPTAFMAALTAFFLARIRSPLRRRSALWGWLFRFTAFIFGGVLVVFWQGSLNADGGNSIERSVDAWDRFALWIDIAINGGISADQVPFAMLFMTVTWIVAFVTTTLTFRYHSPWIPALILGLALLTNLSHRIGMHEQTFYLFMVAAVAQFSHLVSIGRINRWRQAGLSIPKEARWIAARDGLILAVVVMVIAALMPMALPRSATLSDRWSALFLEPITQFRSTAERLLAGVPSGDEDLIYSPNAVLPFQGGIELTDDPVMWIRTRYAKLHPARVYQEYTSQGWVTAPSVALPADSGTKLLVDPSERGIEERARLDITVEPLGKVDLVVPAAAVHAVDYAADVEILEPLGWDVPLAGSPALLAQLPEDIRDFAFKLRERLLTMAEDSPIYSPSNADRNRVPFTLNTQPSMTADEVRSAIRHLQNGPMPITNQEEQITYSVTSSTLEELSLSETGEFIEMTFTMSDVAREELLSTSDSTPETVGIRVSTLTLRENAELNGGNGPDTLDFVITPDDLRELALPDLDPLGSPNPRYPNRFKITAEQLDEMDLSRSGIDWEDFNFRLFAEPDGTNANLMRVVRRGPAEQNTVSFDEVLENQPYNVTTYASTAEAAELEASSDNYPKWIRDRYLALPSSLPREVRDLAADIVAEAGAETPWEKTMAIKEFLQSQVYSLEIVGPGPFDDGIYYFLFETINEPCPTDEPGCDASKRKGYSQYFGSAGTVLLRSVGVPARMIAGWSAGEYVPDQGQFLIRDRNRHGWTQIYAPPYGWIDIEVTPGRASVPRNVLVPTTPTSEIPLGLIGSSEFDPDYLEYLEDLDELALMEQEFLRSLRNNPNASQNTSDFQMPLIPTAVAATVIVLFLAAVSAWRWSLRGQPEPVRAYSQFVRVASLLGYRRPTHMSAREYLSQIGDMTLRYTDTRNLLYAFEECVYGQQKVAQSTVVDQDEHETQDADITPEDDASAASTGQEEPNLGRSWRSLARAVLKHRLLSMFGMTPVFVNEDVQEQYRFSN